MFLKTWQLHIGTAWHVFACSIFPPPCAAPSLSCVLQPRAVLPGSPAAFGGWGSILPSLPRRDRPPKSDLDAPGNTCFRELVLLGMDCHSHPSITLPSVLSPLLPHNLPSPRGGPDSGKRRGWGSRRRHITWKWAGKQTRQEHEQKQK